MKELGANSYKIEKLKIVKNWKTGEAKTLGNWEKEIGTLVNSKTEISTGRLAKKEYTGTLNFKAKQH